ncbi:tetratricopeptide repeat protein [Pirellulaceae bacterium SH449]
MKNRLHGIGPGLLVVVFLWLGVPSECRSDQIILKNGGKLSGKIFPSKEDDMVVIKTDDGIAIQIAKSDVQRQIPSTVVPIDYELLLRQTPDTADANKELAVTCIRNGMSAMGQAHYERVAELAPNDKSAWAAIGYIYEDRYGGWVRRSELNFREGRDVVNGKLMTLFSRAILEKRQEITNERAKIKKEIELAITKLKKNDKDAASAVEFLKTVNDPIAIEYLEKQLKESIDKKLGGVEVYMQMLLQMPGASAAPIFCKIAMRLDLPTAPGGLVDQSLAALNRDEMSQDIAVAYFAARLGSDPKAMYGSLAEFQAIAARTDRAAQNLQGIPGGGAIIPLINSLVTSGTVVTKVNQNQGIDSAGGAGFSSGGNVANSVSVQQQSVLFALQGITGENFNYNQDAWRQWYADKFAKTNLDLRRIE